MPGSYSDGSPPKALCVTRDSTLRRTLKRTLSAAGARVEMRESLDVGDLGKANLILIDRGCQALAQDRMLLEALRNDGKVIFLGESLADDNVIDLLRGANLDHLIGDASAPSSELLVTSVKLLSGDLFGLEKYLSWGVTVHEHAVSTYAEKRDALGSVAGHARGIGGRRSVVTRIESVADELLMNALYDAPAARDGIGAVTRIQSAGGIGSMVADRAALIRFAADGKTFALSVQDEYGELKKDMILDHLARARSEGGRPRPQNDPRSGAGLGLYFILSSVTRFIANVDTGSRTEIICLFDLDRVEENARGAQSLHIFTQDSITAAA